MDKPDNTHGVVPSQCSHDGCTNHARSLRSKLCEKHYYRMRRRGTALLKWEDSPPPLLTKHTNGYIMEYLPSHPLWGETSGRIYQHRRVFFDSFGKGPHLCHWCGNALSWSDMDVDHLNAIKDDNRIENLVASCPACNINRARHKAAEASRSRAVHRFTHDGVTMTAQQWASQIGISRTSLLWRIKSGWPIEKALTQGRGTTGP